MANEDKPPKPTEQTLRASHGDKLYDQQLLRDVQLINTRMTVELGSLPPGGVPAASKRKPNVDYSRLQANAVQSEVIFNEPLPSPSAYLAAAHAPAAEEMVMFNLGNLFKKREEPAAPRNRAAEALASGELPPPPVPKKLRELLKDYPGHIERIQEVLNTIITKPSVATPPFEVAIWKLEGRTSTFVSEAKAELEAAKLNGNPQAIAAAEEKLSLMYSAASNNIGLNDLEEIYQYFDKNKELFP